MAFATRPFKRARYEESDATVLQMDLEVERATRRAMQQTVFDLEAQITELQEQLAQAETRASEAEDRADAAENAELLCLQQLMEQTESTEHIYPQCSVCQESIDPDTQALTLSCGHSLHMQCYEQLLEHAIVTCPLCRASIF